MFDAALIEAVAAYAERMGAGEDPVDTGVADLAVLRRRATTLLEGILYRPSLCLILQGAKETHIGTRTVRFGAGRSVVVSHDLPVASRVVEASRDRPYLALVMGLDISVLRSLADEVSEAGVAADEESADGDAIDDGATDVDLLDAVRRLFELVERPREAPVMAPLIAREIHFRLLLAPHGRMLRRLLVREGHASRIARAIAAIRQDFTAPLSVGALARIAGMSQSTFHSHFKAVTATTPLQYQKDLRLIEARRILAGGGYTVSAAAFAVGYESPTQFSREYARRFGRPPRADRPGALLARAG